MRQVRLHDARHTTITLLAQAGVPRGIVALVVGLWSRVMNGQDYLHAAGRRERAEGLDSWTALMSVLVAKLQAMDLPAPLRPALVEATSHWSGRPGDLVGENAKVWQYIEATHPPGADVATPEGRAARALLCVLMPAGDEEARSMTAEWFAAMADDQQASR